MIHWFISKGIKEKLSNFNYNHSGSTNVMTDEFSNIQFLSITIEMEHAKIWEGDDEFGKGKDHISVWDHCHTRQRSDVR